MNRTLCLLGVSAAASLLVLGISAPSAMATTLSEVHTGSSTAPHVRAIKSSATGRCIQDSANGLRLAPCRNAVTQKFDVYDNPNGTKYFVNRSTGRCVEDAPNGIRANSCNGAGNQMWYLSNWGTGGWGISNKSTRRCVYAYVTQNVYVWGTAGCNWQSRSQSFTLVGS